MSKVSSESGSNAPASPAPLSSVETKTRDGAPKHVLQRASIEVDSAHEQLEKGRPENSGAGAPVHRWRLDNKNKNAKVMNFFSLCDSCCRKDSILDGAVIESYNSLCSDAKSKSFGDPLPRNVHRAMAHTLHNALPCCNTYSLADQFWRGVELLAQYSPKERQAIA